MNPGDIAAQLAVAIAMSPGGDDQPVPIPLDVVEAIAQLLTHLPGNIDMDPAKRLPRTSCGDPLCNAYADVHDLARWIGKAWRDRQPEVAEASVELAVQISNLMNDQPVPTVLLAVLRVAGFCSYTATMSAHPEAFSQVDDRPKGGQATH